MNSRECICDGVCKKTLFYPILCSAEQGYNACTLSTQNFIGFLARRTLTPYIRLRSFFAICSLSISRFCGTRTFHGTIYTYQITSVGHFNNGELQFTYNLIGKFLRKKNIPECTRMRYFYCCLTMDNF